ncbi:MAG: hypothetical protein RSA94_02315 [Mucinivorans sp.]
MKKLFTLFLMAVGVMACQERTIELDNDLLNAGPGDVVVNFTNPVTVDILSSNSRATTTAQEWEKKINSITIIVVSRASTASQAGTDHVEYVYNFPASAIAQSKAILPLGAVITDKANKKLTFYTAVNTTTASITTTSTRQDVEALCDANAISAFYNDTYATMTESAKATQKYATGFTMSDKSSDVTLLEDKPTKVAIPLKRTVSKLEITARTTKITDESSASVPQGGSFESLYPGSALSVTNIVITSCASTSNLFALTSPITFTDGADISQESQFTTPYYNNLFYIFEQAATNPVEISISANFALDGNLSNTADGNIIPIGPYVTKTNLTAGITRNSHYKVNYLINGLTANEVLTTISVEDWATMTVQDIPIGE